MNDAFIVMEANRVCPGHEHRIVRSEIKHGFYDPISERYKEKSDVASNFMHVELECIGTKR